MKEKKREENGHERRKRRNKKKEDELDYDVYYWILSAKLLINNY